MAILLHRKKRATNKGYLDRSLVINRGKNYKMNKVFILGTKEYENCHKTIPRFDLLLVRSYGNSAWLNPNTGKEWLKHGTRALISRRTIHCNILISHISIQTFLGVKLFVIFYNVDTLISCLQTLTLFAAMPKHVWIFGLQNCDILWAIMNVFSTHKV